MTTDSTDHARERQSKDDFNRGYLIAVANIIHLHREDVIAEDVLGELGATRRVLNGLGLTDFDLKPLRKLFRESERKAAINRRKPA